MFETDKDNGEIWFYDAVGADLFFGGVHAGDFKAGLDEMEGEDVTIRVNSPGGDVHTALAIHNMIENYRGKTTVIVDALAASAASYFPLAADEIIMADNSLMMIHAPMTAAFGNASEFREVADVLTKHAEAMSTAYQKRSGKDAEAIDEIFSSEVWYTADEAVAAGFADSKLGESFEIENHLNPATFRFQNAPAALLDSSVNRFAAVIKSPEKGRINALKARLKIAEIS